MRYFIVFIQTIEWRKDATALLQSLVEEKRKLHDIGTTSPVQAHNYVCKEGKNTVCAT